MAARSDSPDFIAFAVEDQRALAYRLAALHQQTDALLRRWVATDPAARGAGTPEPVA